MTKSCQVIAFAASAGGLMALGDVLSGLPADLPVPILIVQHIPPDRVSRIPQILNRHTELAVKVAEEGETLKAGVAYVAPANRHLLVRNDGTLTLTATQRVRYHRPSADVLFRSCAETFGEGTIAVVLSGAGRDAADGAQAISDAGGTVIVQDPETAEHPGMPRATIAVDDPTYILPLQELAPKLMALLEPYSASETS